MNQSIFTSRARTVAASVLLVLLLSACGGDKPDAMLASARDYLAKNDPKAAVIQLKNALQKNPDLPEARYLLGMALYRGGDPVGSETELRKALALKHPVELVVPPLAQALLMQRQYKKLADEFAQTELSQAGAQANLKTTLAVAMASLGKLDLSQAALNAALAADPKYAPALLVQAREKMNQRDFDGALAVADSIIVANPANHEAWKLRGDVYRYGKQKMEEALVEYRKSVEIKPDYIEGHVAILTALVRENRIDEFSKQLELLRKVAPGGVQTRYFDTLLAYQKKDYKLAKDQVQQLLKLAPEHVLALQLAGTIELQTNSFLQAEAYLAKAVQQAPDFVVARRLLVTTYLRTGQSAKALSVLQPALRGENIDPATNAVAGEVYLQNGDLKKAEEFFDKAAKQDPGNTRARTSLALTHLAGGREEAAFAELQDIAALGSGTTADLTLISALLRRKEFDKALKAIDALEKKQPDKPLATNLRGRTLLAKQDLAGARKNFERSLLIDPLYFPSIASLAAMDIADKKPEDARKRFDVVLAKDPKNAQVLLALVELRARSGGTKEEVAELMNRAVSANPSEISPRLLLVDFYLRNADLKQAMATAQSAVAAIPDSPELQDALGRVQQASGDMNQALAAYKTAAALQPLSAQPHMRLFSAYMAAKDKNAATQSLRKALTIKSDLLDAQMALILLALDAKNLSEAQSIAKEVQKQRPKEAAGYLLEGDIAASEKKWDAAVDAYRAGLKQVASGQLAVKMHAVLGEAGKAAEADRFAAAWLKDNPKDAVLRLYLGDRALEKSDYAGAEKMYLGVTQIQPDNGIALNNLAWVTGRLNKPGAIAYAEKAVALVPPQAAYMDTLAMLLSDKNDHAKALEWQDKAIAADPQNGVFKLNLARIHIRAGNKDLARKTLDDLAKLGDKFRGQSEVANLMKTL